MDRPLSRVLNISLATCGLAILITAPGCRSTRNEVPPGKPYSTTGAPAVGFNSDPRTGSASNSGGIYGNNPIAPGLGQNPSGLGGGSPTSPMGGMVGSGAPPVEYGTPAPTQGAFGAPTSNRYGSIPATPGSPAQPGGN
jgi:hypothetical protein